MTDVLTPLPRLLAVVEQYPGTGSTDFWGISFWQAVRARHKHGVHGVIMHFVVWRVLDSTGQLHVHWRFTGIGTAQLDELPAALVEAVRQNIAHAPFSGGAGALQAFHTHRFDGCLPALARILCCFH